MVDRILLESTAEELANIVNVVNKSHKEYCQQCQCHVTRAAQASVDQVICFLPYALGDQDDQGGLLEFQDPSDASRKQLQSVLDCMYMREVGGDSVSLNQLGSTVAICRFRASMQALLSTRCDAEMIQVQQVIERLAIPCIDANATSFIADPVGHLITQVCDTSGHIGQWMSQQRLYDMIHLFHSENI